jgi:hypothetical protein
MWKMPEHPEEALLIEVLLAELPTAELEYAILEYTSQHHVPVGLASSPCLTEGSEDPTLQLRIESGRLLAGVIWHERQCSRKWAWLWWSRWAQPASLSGAILLLAMARHDGPHGRHVRALGVADKTRGSMSSSTSGAVIRSMSPSDVKG